MISREMVVTRSGCDHHYQFWDCGRNGRPIRFRVVMPSARTAFLSNGQLLPPGRRFRLVLVLGFLTALGPLTIDMYLPALPAITADLQTTAAAVQLTLTGTLLG